MHIRYNLTVNMELRYAGEFKISNMNGVNASKRTLSQLQSPKMKYSYLNSQSLNE